MTYAAFVAQLRHTCTIRVASEDSTDVHGQPVLSWADEETKHACLWQVRSGGLRNDPYAARIDYDGVLFLVYDGDFDETRQITNIKTGSTVIEAGPLKVAFADAAAGQEHHLELYCKRTDIQGIS